MCVKPFVKRQKSGSSDAAAIVEAAQCPTMLFRTRALPVRQRTQTINSLRGHLSGFGVAAPQGAWIVEALRVELERAKETRSPNRSPAPMRRSASGHGNARSSGG